VVSDALTYVNAESKVAQDSFMLFQCIFVSLDTEFLKSVTTEAQHYHVVDTKAPQEPPIPCGALLLKIIIMKAHVDTRETVSFIRTDLSSLDTKMMALDSDISKFNAYVKTQVIALEARGETTSDLLVNVFKGYETALFIKRKKDANFELPRPLLTRTSALLPRISARRSKTGSRIGLGRRSFPRRENLSPRLWMAKLTIWRVSITPSNAHHCRMQQEPCQQWGPQGR
jgi:hypothetical protein